jgi:RHS repeat-associated protein
MKKSAKILIAIGASLGLTFGIAAFSYPNTSAGRAQALYNGQLNGQFSITQNGAVNYDIQLSLPPGTANFQPNMEIDYSSQSSNGLAGMGFSLSGFSRITRVGATIAQDGFKGGVNYDSGDRLQLDGSRLMNINATNDTYCYDGAVFMTQLQSWTKVIAQGQAGQGADWFSVQLKNGTRLQYGNTPDSKVLAQGQAFASGSSAAGSVREWLLNQATDLNGNSIQFFYTGRPKDKNGNTIANLSGSGVSYPDVICYTTGHGLKAQRKVKFYYERRSDTLIRYQGGAGVVIPLRLAGMKTLLLNASGDSTIVNNYALSYSSSSLGISRMASLVQQGAKGSYTQPTSFNWTNGASGLVPSSSVSWGGPTSSNTGFEGDFNGDGLTDIVPVSGNNISAIYFSTGSGFSKTALASSIVTNPNTFVADYNGDGLPDLFVCTSSSAGRIYFCNGQGFGSPVNVSGLRVNTSGSNCAWAADFNGDGKSDFLTIQGSAAYLSLGSSTGLTYKGSVSGLTLTQGQIFVADYNGDGLNDIYSGNNKGGNLYLSDFSKGNGFQPVIPVGGINTSNVNSCSQCNLIADFNADGMTDIMTHTGSQYNLYYSNGHGFESATALSNISLNISQNWISDFNGDGFMDFYAQNSQGDSSMIYYFTGRNFVKNTLKPTNFIPTASWLGDFNGDGIADIFAANKSQIWYGGDAANNSVPRNNQVPNLVSAINNGIGGVQKVIYQAITDTAVYTKGTTSGTAVDGLNFQNTFNATPISPAQISLYPFSRVQNAMYVVKSYSSSDGRGNAYGYSYHYAGTLMDMQGYGWLGFRTVTKTDTSVQNITTTNYLQTFPYTGKTQSTSITDLSKRLLNQTKNQYATKTVTRGALGSVLYTVNQQASRAAHYDYGSYAYTTGSNYQYDTFGNNTLTANLGDTTKPANTVYTINTYINDTVNWVIGLTGSSMQSADAAGKNPLTQNKYTYYPGTYKLQSQSQWLNTNNSWLTDTYGYDAWGNTTWHKDVAGDTSVTVYDSIYHSFPVRQITPPNQWGVKLFSQAIYNPAFGKATTMIDANRNEFKLMLDQFGRDSLFFGPDSSGTPCLLGKIGYMKGDSAGYIRAIVGRNDWAGKSWDSSATAYDGMERDYLDISLGENRQLILQKKTYNSSNKVIKKSNPFFKNSSPVWTSISYDPYLRIVQVVRPQSNTHNITEKLSYKGKTVTAHQAVGTPDSTSSFFAFDFYNGSRKMVQRTNQNKESTFFAYDLLGNDTLVTDPTGLKTSYADNSLGDMIKTKNPSAGSSRIIYDYPNRMYYTINNMNDTVTTYLDKLKRTIRERRGKNGSYYYQYDNKGYKNGAGNICKIMMPDTGFYYEYAYNAYQNPVRSLLHIDGKSYVERFMYNPNQSVNGMVYPDSSLLQNTYYSNGLLKQVLMADSKSATKKPVSYLSLQQYNAAGNPQSLSYGNTVKTYNSYNAQNNLSYSSTKSAGKSPLSTLTYNWNDLDEITSIIDSVRTSYSQRFHYQPAGRLDTAVGGYGKQVYRYDASGNMLMKDSIQFQYSNYQVSSGTKNGRTVFKARYDANGNLKQRTWSQGKDSVQTRYTYDVLNRLVAISNAKDTLFAFIYNHTGQRVKKINYKTKTSTLYVSGNYEMTRSPNGIIYTKYVSAPTGLVASVSRTVSSGTGNGIQNPGLPGAGTLYFHQDNVNSTKLTTDASGNVSTQAYYKPFGEEYALKGNGPNNFRYRFGSKEMDESGLYYFNARYYDPVTARFTSSDDQLGGHKWQSDVYNRYAYTINNPIKYSDPSGHGLLNDAAIGAVLGIEVFVAVGSGGVAIPEEIAGDVAVIAEDEVGTIALKSFSERTANGVSHEVGDGILEEYKTARGDYNTDAPTNFQWGTSEQYEQYKSHLGNKRVGADNIGDLNKNRGFLDVELEEGSRARGKELNVHGINDRFNSTTYSSGKFKDPGIFSHKKVYSDTYGKEITRQFDTERKMLTDLTRAIDPNAKPGNIYRNVKGTVHLFSEFHCCESCQDAMSEFAEMFPNIKLYQVDPSCIY